MKRNILNSIVLAGLLLTTNIIAEDIVVKEKNNEESKLMDIAGEQRMLSQRLVKDYLYIGANVSKNKVSKELEETLIKFRKNKKYILLVENSEDLNNLMSFVSMSLEEFEELLKEEHNIDNSQVAIDLGEAILEGSQFVVNNLKVKYSNNSNNIIAISGKQRMLSQRIALYYIAYREGIKDNNTIEQMNLAIKTFTDTHNKLMRNNSNNIEINKKLKEVDKLWKIVSKFYTDIETGGLPFIVYSSTNKITKKMDDITKLYKDIKITKGE